jgi:hypothetical protein
MNKQEALTYLKEQGAKMSARTFLRHVASEKIGVDHTRNVADYDPDGVRRLADKLTNRTYVSREPAQTALTVPGRDTGLSQYGAGSSEMALERVLSRAVAATMSAAMVEPAPSVWLTIDGAAEWLGLPRSAITKALREDRGDDEKDNEKDNEKDKESKSKPKTKPKPQRTIKTHGSGGGLRLHSVSIRAYFERPRQDVPNLDDIV